MISADPLQIGWFSRAWTEPMDWQPRLLTITGRFVDLQKGEAKGEIASQSCGSAPTGREVAPWVLTLLETFSHAPGRAKGDGGEGA